MNNEIVLPLNEEQLKMLPQDTDRNARPVRFMCRRKSVNLCTGHLTGGNVMYQMVYWDRPESFINLALDFLRENNPNEDFSLIYSD